MNRVALFTQQVSHYHAARYRAANARIDGFRVFSWANSADFAEFLGPADSAIVTTVFSGQDAYGAAVRSGSLWRRVHNEMDAYGPDIVAIAGWSFPESVAAIAWARKAGARIVLMSASQPHDAPRTDWRESVKRRVVSACDAALVAAGPHADYASHLGIPFEHVFFGYDAVDNDYFSKAADRVRSQRETVATKRRLPERYLLASGRFIEKKNFPRLVRAFARALENGDSGHHLVILGDGTERPSIEQAIRQAGIAGRVHLPGFVDYEGLPDFYGLAEGFVHVALAEQWGLVVNEAAASGLPLIVSRPCGASTVLVEPGVNGFLLEPTDLGGMTQALARLMGLSEDARRSMGTASREIVGHWGTERYSQGLKDACEAAYSMPARALRPLDRALFRALSRMQFSAVQ